MRTWATADSKTSHRVSSLSGSSSSFCRSSSSLCVGVGSFSPAYRSAAAAMINVFIYSGLMRDARRLRELEAEIRALRKKLEEKDRVIDILKKIRRHTFQTIEDKYRYIRTARAGASVELVCRLLEVSRSGYYEWMGRKPSLRRQKDQELKRRLLSLHQRYPALGLDSLYHLIRPQLSCSRKRIHRLMNEMNISSTRRRAYKATTARRFSFDKPDTAWVGDITYIPHRRGLALLRCCERPLHKKQIVGYAFSDRIDTNLTLAALGMAVRRRKASARPHIDLQRTRSIFPSSAICHHPVEIISIPASSPESPSSA